MCEKVRECEEVQTFEHRGTKLIKWGNKSIIGFNYSTLDHNYEGEMSENEDHAPSWQISHRDNDSRKRRGSG